MKYSIRHVTVYRYGDWVSNCQTKLWMLPRALPYQQCLSSGVEVRPAPAQLPVERADFFGNRTLYFSIQRPHDRMELVAECLIDRQAPAWPDPPALPWRASLAQLPQAPDYARDIAQFLLPSPYIVWNEAIVRYAQESFKGEVPLFQAVKGLMGRLHQDFAFVPGATTLATPLATVMAERKGVCQDFSHLMLAFLRCMGVPARYVSGYLETLPPPGKAKLQGADASHAWLAAYLPGMGWVDFDPTNDVLPGERHITVAWGRDYGDVPPAKGIIRSSGQHALEVAVDVVPLPVPV
jgi:transglutaminase-like putative cysteine protease